MGTLHLCYGGNGKVLCHVKSVDILFQSKYESVCEALESSLTVLRYLIKGNTDVQNAVFTRLDTLLNIKSLDKPLANALTEVSEASSVVV